MTNKEAISDLETLLAYIPIYRRFYQSISMGIKALEQADVLQRLRKRISDLYNTDVTYDNGDINTMDTPTLDKVLEYFDSEVKI